MKLLKTLLIACALALATLSIGATVLSDPDPIPTCGGPNQPRCP